MSVQILTVGPDEADLRLDRWFKRHFPALGHGRLEKLLRTGQIRVDGKRAKAAQRLEAGQAVRVPPLGDLEEAGARPDAPPRLAEADGRMIRDCVLYRDDWLIVLNKPPGLATQGGTGTTRHVDGLLDALRFGAEERPRLVHRLDKDTSGVLVIARTARAAAALTRTFRSRDARKLYWALVVGVPTPAAGTIRAAVAKVEAAGAEKMEVDLDDGKHAVTDYRVVDTAHRTAAWLEMEPRTGRTHQLRVHAAFLGTPILGDGKYGGTTAHLQGSGVSRKLHLHARAIRIPHPQTGKPLEVVAPLPEHLAASFAFFAFAESAAGPPFAAMPEAGT